MIKKSLKRVLFALLLVPVFSSCGDDTLSYAELLEREDDAIGAYLANYKVVDGVPSNLEFDENTFYALGDRIYMRVLEVGNLEVKAEKGDLVYFRYERTNLLDQSVDKGNINMPVAGPLEFIYRAYEPTYSQYTTYGTGIGEPLDYLGEGARVEIIIPAAYGFTTGASSVTPYLFLVDYPRIF